MSNNLEELEKKEDKLKKLDENYIALFVEKYGEGLNFRNFGVFASPYKKTVSSAPFQKLRGLLVAKGVELNDKELALLLEEEGDRQEESGTVGTRKLDNFEAVLKGDASESVGFRDERFTIGFRATWNWAAFFFGPLWYLAKGMWLKALVMVVVSIISSGVLAPFIWFYCAIVGNYDLFLLKEKSTQSW